MRNSIFLLVALLVSSATSTAAQRGGGHSGGGHSGGTVHVSGYYRSNGTYVAPHERTAPDGTKGDNWSTRGNVNPYTGKEGSKRDDGGSGAPPYTAPSESYSARAGAVSGRTNDYHTGLVHRSSATHSTSVRRTSYRVRRTGSSRSSTVTHVRSARHSSSTRRHATYRHRR